MNDHDPPPLFPIWGSSETHSNERRVVFSTRVLLWSMIGMWFLIGVAGIVQSLSER